MGFLFQINRFMNDGELTSTTLFDKLGKTGDNEPEIANAPDKLQTARLIFQYSADKADDADERA